MSENKIKDLNMMIIAQEKKIEQYEKVLNRISNRTLSMYLSPEDAARDFKRIAKNALSN
jgi:uncharacterized coiled-coil protein SlyX